VTTYEVFAELNLTKYMEQHYRCYNCHRQIYVLIIGEPTISNVASDVGRLCCEYRWRCTNGDCGCSHSWSDNLILEKGEPKRDDK